MTQSDSKPLDTLSGLTLDELLGMRPNTLTVTHAEACLPRLEIDPEWKTADRPAGSSPSLRQLSGSLLAIWPDECLSDAEAAWILAMREHCSWRELASFVTGDGNQITGMHLEEAARRVLPGG